jgi:3-hydroxybutyryl-CoA dehydrogenase
MTKLRIGVVGAGTMGRGIVQLFAQSGHSVSLFDTADGALPKAMAAVGEMIDRGVKKGTYPAQRGEQIKALIRPCTTLEALGDCEVVIEAIVEEMEAKRALLQALERIVSPQVILASNTSSLVVAEIAAACTHPGRVAGLHFFNPVPLMKVVEVVASVRTTSQTVETLRQLVADSGHRAVITADQPGFLVNHAGRGLYTEGLRILEERVASCADVDLLMREAADFRMGPFELLDLTGLDVSGKVMQSIYEQFQHEPRFRPSSLLRPRVAAGLYGRKTGAGWYVYDAQGKPPNPPEPATSRLSTGLKVWIDPVADDRESVAALGSTAGAVRVMEHSLADLCVVQPWGQDASGYCADHLLDARKTVAIDPLPGLQKRRTLMLTAVTEPSARDAALTLMRIDGAKVTVINDSPGFVVQRVLATIVNIAAEIAQRGIASVSDLEDAVMLGLGYPKGPLSIGDGIGGARVLSILRGMQSATGDPRYRPAPWLVRRARLSLPLLTLEARRQDDN